MIEDYSAFSWEAIQQSIRDMLDDVKRETGASDEEIQSAFLEAAQRFMEINCFKLEGGSK